MARWWPLALLLVACGAPRPLPGMDLLESARVCLETQRYGKALDFAEAVIDQQEDSGAEQPGSRARGEAAWIGGEAALALGKHLKAFRHYQTVLESAPWLPQVALIEQRLYDIGTTFLYADEYGGWFDSRARGVEVLEALQVHFRHSELADDSLRHVADWFGSEEEREWVEAAIVYQRLVDEYPDSEWAERSLWLAGHCRLRSVPGPRYNREELLRAEELLDRSVRTHPRGVAIGDARDDLQRCRELLARGEVLVADFYAGRQNSVGEQLRLANAALRFPDTEAGAEARGRLEAAGLLLDDLAAEPALNAVDALRARPAQEQQR